MREFYKVFVVRGFSLAMSLYAMTNMWHRQAALH